MEKIATFLGMALLGAVLLGGLVSYFVMLLWNSCLVPAISGVNTIS